jgi:hypothetical protein
MPQLTNTQWEAACQARANGGDVAASYKAGGYTGNPGAATKFFHRDVIRARVMEIQDEAFKSQRRATEIATKKAGLEESWIIERVKYAIEIALRGEPILDANGNPTGKFGKRNVKAAIDGLRLASDFKGMRIQRHEVGGPGDFARMTDDELDASLVETARALGFPEATVTQFLSDRSSDTDSTLN